MLNRIIIRFGISFIYVLLIKGFIVSNTFFEHSLSVVFMCIVLAMLYTLFLEAWQYLLIDLIPFSKWVILGILIVSIGICSYGVSNYILLSLLYLDIVMIISLYKSYKMHKALQLFKQKEFL